MENLSDNEIIEKVRNGNQELFAEIIKRYQDKLLRYSSNLIKDRDRATDAVQSSFIKAYVNLNGFDTSKKFSSWIYRIVHNETLNLIGKDQKNITLPDGFDIESEEDIELDFEKKETRNLVENCLGTMPIIYSEPLTLFYVENKSYEEISDILRIPMGTVATRISRAKLLMKKICLKK